MRTWLISSTVLLGVGLVGLLAGLLPGQQTTPLGSDGVWTAMQVLQPAELARTLQSKQATQPKVLNVGFAVLYNSKHIPGSVYAGQGSKDEGIAELKEAVAAVPKDSQIVLYCGCCPMDPCPNLR